MPRKLDLALAAGFALLGVAIGGYALQLVGLSSFYQNFMPETVYWACGHGFVRPVHPPQPLMDFLFARTRTFDCTALGPLDNLGPAGFFFRLHLYLGLSASALWRMSSIAYGNLWPLVGGLVGAYTCGCYVLLRLFFKSWPAAAGALVLALSPAAFTEIVLLRDYGKAPFFVWVLVLLILALRAPTWRMALLWSALAGAGVGIGFGFRSDVFILLPVGILMLVLGLGPKAWGVRAAAIAAFTAATLLFASPILKAGNRGGFGTLMMQGMTEPYRNYLSMGPAPYSFGSRYSDELTLSSVAADLRPGDPDWDAHEGQPGQSTSQAIRRSGSYVLGWLPLFAGDVATQALKSAGWLIAFPALVLPGHPGLDPGSVVRQWPEALALTWLPLLCPLGFVVFFWRLAANRPREAVALFLSLGALLTYPVVQFSMRHVFHLEFIWVMSILALFHAPFEWPKLRAILPRFSIAAAVAVAAIILARTGLTAYQDRALRSELEAMLAQPREPVAVIKKALDGGKTAFAIPLPERYRALVEGPADSMTPLLPEIGVQWNVRAAGDRLLLTLGGANCPPGKVTLSLRYAKREAIWQPLDNDITVELPQDRELRTTVLAPAFYRPTQYLSDIEVASDRAGCIAGVERMVGHTRLPMVLSVSLVPGWQSRSLHHDFGNFPLVIAPAK
jgi:4-amino-4-deoxy-L-arabinose transferase-like glycosyltransferase